MSDFSDYIVFVDESGDHGLKTIDPTFPVFALCFCVIKKRDYIDKIVPAFQKFKFDYWGHDAVILHSHEIRKSKGQFTLLMSDSNLRERFYSELNAIMSSIPVRVIASVIDKQSLRKRYSKPFNPYEIALLFCLERIRGLMLSEGQEGKKVPILFEGRGRVEDKELELQFRRICDNKINWGYKKPDFSTINFDPTFCSKAINSTGLQIADLFAHPIARNYLNKEKPNRAYEIIKDKIEDVKLFP